MIAPPEGKVGITEIFGPPMRYDSDPRLALVGLEDWYPEGIPLSWSPSQRAISIHCHHLIGPPIVAVLHRLKDWDALDMIKTYGGCHNYREITGGGKLSTHSWGIAIDINTATNPRGKHGDMPFALVAAFEKYGFVWGGRFENPDPMHFQFAREY